MSLNNHSSGMLSIVLLLTAPLTARAATVEICADPEACQQSLEDALDVDGVTEIIVHPHPDGDSWPGTGFNSITIHELLIRAADGANGDDRPILGPNGANSTVEVADGVQDLVIRGLELQPDARRAIEVGAYAEVLIDDVVVANHDGSDDGMAVYANPDAMVTIRDSLFSDLYNGRDGIVYAEEAVVVVEGTDFIRNTADLGGAIFLEEGALHIDDSLFEDNEAYGEGGALYLEVADLMVDDSEFWWNYSDYDGGAIYMKEGSLYVDTSTFGYNETHDDGGALFLDWVESEVVDTIFMGNSGWHGGAILADDGTLEIRGSHFDQNNASRRGGAIHGGWLDTITLEDSRFFENQSGRSGGAVNVESANGLRTERSLFCSNENTGQNGHGGGLRAASTNNVAILNTVFAWNRSVYTDGGGLYGNLSGVGSLVIRNNAFLGNAASQGAGLHLDGGMGDDGLLANNLVAWTEQAEGVRTEGFDELDASHNAYYSNTEGHASFPIGADTNDIVDQNPLLSTFDPDGTSCNWAPGDPNWGVDPMWGSPLIGAGHEEYENPEVTPEHDAGTFDSGAAPFEVAYADIGPHGGPDANPQWWLDNDGDGWPHVYDCDDDDSAAYPDQTWWADCDGDGYHGAATVTACGEPVFADEALWEGDWPEACDDADPLGGWTDDLDPDVYAFDCDDSDPTRFPGQTWWADCDGDGYYQGEPLLSCNEPVAEAGCENDDHLGEWVHEDPEPPYDCNDNDADVQFWETWWADCDGDGVFGKATVEACGEPVFADEGLWDGDWPEACEDDPPQGGWTNQEPQIFDCDDTNPDVQEVSLWWADCDGDGVYGAVTVEACGEPSFEDAELWSGDWPEACDQEDPAGGWTDALDPDTYDFDCNDADPTAQYAETWWADCDGDGAHGEATVESCGIPVFEDDHLWAGEWPEDCNEEAPEGGWTTGIDPVNYDFDCDDADSNIQGSVEWYADCDGDGVFGEHTLDSCGVPEPDGNNWEGAWPPDCHDEDENRIDPVDSADANHWTYDLDAFDEPRDEDGNYIFDCNDGNPNQFPGNDVLLCDGLDNNCDGFMDAGDMQDWYPDADGDGYGDADAEPQESCEDLSDQGFVLNNLDCDDNNANIHPETIWCKDADGDGYGDPENCLEEGQCEPPEEGNWVYNDLDCDDTNPDIHPDTIWFEDIDDNGYGDPDSTAGPQCEPPKEGNWVLNDLDCDPGNPDLPVKWFEDIVGNGYGDPDSYVVDCEQPPGYVDNDLDCAPEEYDLPKLWYKDENGDGYGDPDDYVLDCDQPDGYVDTPLDCDLPEVDHPDCDPKDADEETTDRVLRFGGSGRGCHTAAAPGLSPFLLALVALVGGVRRGGAHLLPRS